MRPRLTAPQRVGQRTQFFQQSGRQRLGFVHDQHEPRRHITGGFDRTRQCQTQLVLIPTTGRHFQRQRHAAPEATAGRKTAIAQQRDAMAGPELLGQHLAQHRLAGACGPDEQSDPLLPLDTADQCLPRMLDRATGEVTRRPRGRQKRPVSEFEVCLDHRLSALQIGIKPASTAQPARPLQNTQTAQTHPL